MAIHVERQLSPLHAGKHCAPAAGLAPWPDVRPKQAGPRTPSPRRAQIGSWSTPRGRCHRRGCAWHSQGRPPPAPVCPTRAVSRTQVTPPGSARDAVDATEGGCSQVGELGRNHGESKEPAAHAIDLLSTRGSSGSFPFPHRQGSRRLRHPLVRSRPDREPYGARDARAVTGTVATTIHQRPQPS
jgi:hypothetical protein